MHDFHAHELAGLISLSLSQSSLAVGFLYNIVYGYETYDIVRNPLFQSTSVAEFWGRRWNLLVHKGLKNGVYKPVRKVSASPAAALLAAFIVSGIIHEYVNSVMFYGSRGGDYRFKWKQMIFFGWNGLLIIAENMIAGWTMVQQLRRKVPRFLITALVVSSALPIAHLFTSDWVRYGYFDAVYGAEFVFVCSDSL